MNKKEYQEYLKSERWKTIRQYVLFRDSYFCRHCGMPAFEVHHLTYRTLKTPKEIDHCIAICRPCHQKIHDGEKLRGEIL